MILSEQPPTLAQKVELLLRYSPDGDDGYIPDWAFALVGNGADAC
jgi:hypothetical protein